MAFEAIRRAFTQAPITALSPDDLKRRRDRAEKDYGPSDVIYPHWASVLNEGLKGVLGGLEDRRLNKAEETARGRNTELIMAALGMGAPPSGGMGSTSPFASPSRSPSTGPTPQTAWDPADGTSGPPRPSTTGVNFRHPEQASGLSESAQGVLDRLVASGVVPSLDVTSAYRSPEYNARVGGARGSQHTHGNALDIALAGYTPEQQQALVQGILADPSVNGFGYYPNSNSIHFDTRSGPRAYWGQDYSRNSWNAPDWMNQQVMTWAGQMAQGQPMQVAQSGQQVNPAILQALMDPWTDPSMRGVLAQLYTQQTTPPDPTQYLREINGQLVDLRTGQVVGDYRDQAGGRGPIEINGQLVDPETYQVLGDYRDAPEPPALDADLQEFQQAQQLGLIPPDMTLTQYQESKRSRTDIHLPGQPNIGSIPPGWQATQGEDGSWSMTPITGGPAEAESLARDRAAEDMKENLFGEAQLVNQDIDRAIGQIEAAPWRTTGWVGNIAGAVGDPAYKNVASLLTTVRSHIALDRLQALKAASPVGASGFGALSERELSLLEGYLGSLDQAQTAEQLIFNLRRIQDSYQRTIQLLAAEYGVNPAEIIRGPGAMFDPSPMGAPQTFGANGGGPPPAMQQPQPAPPAPAPPAPAPVAPQPAAAAPAPPQAAPAQPQQPVPFSTIEPARQAALRAMAAQMIQMNLTPDRIVAALRERGYIVTREELGL